MNNPDHLAVGTLLQHGKYRIVRFIGAGGFGCTYEAEFEMLHRRVAIKEFFPHELCNRDATGRMTVGTNSQCEFVAKLRRKFADEARTLFDCTNLEGVVKVTDIFEENDTSYFVMQYIDGQSLGSMINSRGPLPEAEALHLITEVGRALAGVHEHGMLHLDIKPDNIMIDAQGHPILIDFGVSKQYDNSDGCNTSTLMGCTPGYAPIEQMKSNVKAFLPATDIYALGATLCAMLTGKTPPDASELLNDPDLLALPASVSDSTRRAIIASMEPRVKGRPKTVAEFLAMLGYNNAGASAGNVNGKLYNSNAGVGMHHGATSQNGGASSRNGGTRIVEGGQKRNCLTKILLGIAASLVIVIVAKISGSSDGAELTAADSISGDNIAAAVIAATAGQSAPAPNADSGAAQPVDEPEPAAEGAPASSSRTETAMIAAYTAAGHYRAYTLADWDGFTAGQRAAVTPVGVQLTASGQQFVIAPTDAGGGKGYEWDDPNSVKDYVDIPGLKNISSETEAKRDFNGMANTKTILDYGRQTGITYPAAKAATDYRYKGYGGWYLPASGQLWLMYENHEAINKALSKIGGSCPSDSWSSTEESSYYIYYVTVPYGFIYTSYKGESYPVRPVAPVSLPSRAK